MFRQFCFLTLLLLIFGAEVALSQDASTGAIDRANSQRTGVYGSTGVQRPEDKGWQSEKLFAMQRVRMHVSQGWDYSRGEPPFTMNSLTYSTSFGFYYSPPIVFDQTIYFTLYIGDGYVFAVDANTGKLKWKMMRTKGRFTYPTIAGQYLYFGTNTFFHAIDLKTRREVWKYETGDIISPHLSPVIVGGVVYFGSSNGNFYAIDAETGQAKWIFKAGKRTYWVSPALGSETVYCAESQGEIHALNVQTGEERWKFQTPKGVASILAGENNIYFVDYEGYIRALDINEAQLAADFRQSNRAGTELALYDGHIYFGGWHSGSVYAVDAKTGAGIWRFRMEDQCSSPVIADGMVHFTCPDEKLYAVDAKTGKKAWAVDTKQSIMSAPAVAENAIYYISDDGKVHAVK